MHPPRHLAETLIEWNDTSFIALAGANGNASTALAKLNIYEHEVAALIQAHSRLEEDLCDGVVPHGIARGLYLPEERVDLVGG